MIQALLSVGLVAGSALAVATFPRSVLVFLLFQGSLLFVYRARIPERLRWSLLAAALLVLMPVIGYFNSYYLEVDPGRDLRRAGAGPQHRGRPGRAPGPRLRGLLRRRRVFLGHLRLAARERHLRGRLSAGRLVVLCVPPRGTRSGGHHRDPAWPARAAPPRRLPGHRHAWLR